MAAPFGLKHCEDGALKLVEQWLWLLHFRTTGNLRPRQKGVEKGSAGIGVDFDEFRIAIPKVKVVAHKSAERAVIDFSNCWGPGVESFAIALQDGGSFDCKDNFVHRRAIRFGQKNRTL